MLNFAVLLTGGVGGSNFMIHRWDSIPSTIMPLENTVVFCTSAGSGPTLSTPGKLECAPPLTWRSMPFDHVFSHTRLGDFKAELAQFAVDARGTPQRVLDTHAPDQGAQ